MNILFQIAGIAVDSFCGLISYYLLLIIVQAEKDILDSFKNFWLMIFKIYI